MEFKKGDKIRMKEDCKPGFLKGEIYIIQKYTLLKEETLYIESHSEKDRCIDLNHWELVEKSKTKKNGNSDLLKAGVKELRFAHLQRDYLLSVLCELETFTGKLERKVIKNAIERHNLDKIIHSKIIFFK